MIRPLSVVRLSLMTLLLVGVPGRDRAAAAGHADARETRVTAESDPARRADIATIVAALARGTAGPAFRLKAADKLATLDDRQLRVMASLSQRVTAGGDGPADGIARLLITALLILS